MENITQTRPCEVAGVPAFFHRWITEDRAVLNATVYLKKGDLIGIRKLYDEYGIVPECCILEKLTETWALVELYDGIVRKVPLNVLRFTDRGGE